MACHFLCCFFPLHRHQSLDSMPGLSPTGEGGGGLRSRWGGDARQRGPSALPPNSQPEVMGRDLN